MTQHGYETATAGDFAHLVSFEWGAASGNVYLTNWSDDIIVGSEIYSATPEMELDIGQLTIGLEDEPSTILLPRTVQPVTRLARLPYRGRIVCTIMSCAPSNVLEIRTLYRGVVAFCRTNIDGNPQVCELTIDSIKKFIQRRVGLVAGRTDPYWLGHPANAIVLSGYQQSVTVNAVSGLDSQTTVQIVKSGFTPTTDEGWRNGYIECDGERLGIRAYLGTGVPSNSHKFELTGVADADWVGQDATMTQGWDGSLAGAANFTGLASRFAGAGLYMPDRNPVFQSGGQS